MTSGTTSAIGGIALVSGGATQVVDGSTGGSSSIAEESIPVTSGTTPAMGETAPASGGTTPEADKSTEESTSMTGETIPTTEEPKSEVEESASATDLESGETKAPVTESTPVTDGSTGESTSMAEESKSEVEKLVELIKKEVSQPEFFRKDYGKNDRGQNLVGHLKFGQNIRMNLDGRIVHDRNLWKNRVFRLVFPENLNTFYTRTAPEDFRVRHMGPYYVYDITDTDRSGTVHHMLKPLGAVITESLYRIHPATLNYHTVTYYDKNTDGDKKKLFKSIVLKGSKVQKSFTPIINDDREFIEWVDDQGQTFDFGNPINSKTEVFAKWKSNEPAPVADGTIPSNDNEVTLHDQE